jgi:hypothetical protein
MSAQEIRALGESIPEEGHAYAYCECNGSDPVPPDRSPLPWRYNISLPALNDAKEPLASAAPSEGWNWHKALGPGTIVTALGALASGYAGLDGPHCGLAALPTGLTAATCVNGFWSYGNIFSAGDTRLGIHAVSGILSTVCFGAATALAEGAPHGKIGSASGVLFMVTAGVVYF